MATVTWDNCQMVAPVTEIRGHLLHQQPTLVPVQTWTCSGCRGYQPHPTKSTGIGEIQGEGSGPFLASFL